jgi:hypothetical protein
MPLAGDEVILLANSSRRSDAACHRSPPGDKSTGLHGSAG